MTSRTRPDPPGREPADPLLPRKRDGHERRPEKTVIPEGDPPECEPGVKEPDEPEAPAATR